MQKSLNLIDGQGCELNVIISGLIEEDIHLSSDKNEDVDVATTLSSNKENSLGVEND